METSMYGKKLLISLMIFILLISLVSALNNYCNRFSTNPKCICKENETKVSVWKTPDCFEGKFCIGCCKVYYGYAYHYCEREGKEKLDYKIANNIYNAINKR